MILAASINLSASDSDSDSTYSYGFQTREKQPARRRVVDFTPYGSRTSGSRLCSGGDAAGAGGAGAGGAGAGSSMSARTSRRSVYMDKKSAFATTVIGSMGAIYAEKVKFDGIRIYSEDNFEFSNLSFEGCDGRDQLMLRDTLYRTVRNVLHEALLEDAYCCMDESKLRRKQAKKITASTRRSAYRFSIQNSDSFRRRARQFESDTWASIALNADGDIDKLRLRRTLSDSNLAAMKAVEATVDDVVEGRKAKLSEKLADEMKAMRRCLPCSFVPSFD